MAIAFDAATNPSYQSSATTHTFSHTCTGSERILWVQTWRRGGTTVSGVTYNSVAMTSLGSEIQSGTSGSAEYVQMWYLAGPSTGSNSIVVTCSTAAEHIDSAVSYTGASQTGIPDALNSLANTTQTNSTGTVTTVADNCWAIMYIRQVVNGSSDAGSGTTRRTNVIGFTQTYDGNGAKTPAGSYSLNVTHNNSSVGWWMASFAPYVAPSTSISSITGVAIADVSSRSGIAIASIASVSGIANS